MSIKNGASLATNDALRSPMSVENGQTATQPSTGLRSVMSTVDKHINAVDRHTKAFGAFTLLTAIIVVGMSIYVVHNTEFRFPTSNQVLVNDAGPLATATAESTVGLDHESLTDQVLAHLKRVNLKTQNGDTIGWDVMAYEKRVSDGLVVLHGPGERVLVITDGTPKSEAAAAEHGDIAGTNVTVAGSRRRRLMYTGRHGRLLDATAGSASVDATSTVDGGGNGQSSLPPPPTDGQDPNEETPFWMDSECTREDTRSTHKSTYTPKKPCNCLLRKYWADPNAATCATRPVSNPSSDPNYLDKWAYLGEDCSARPCFNFGANTKVPYEDDYKGNSQWQADAPDDAYTGRMGPGGYMGGAPGQLEALSCRGKVTQKRPWWKWWASDVIDYKCVLRSDDEYARRGKACSCRWFEFFGCDGYDPACGPHGQCFLTAMDGNKYCQTSGPIIGQSLAEYA